MKPIESAFHPIDGYMSIMERDTVHGWYFLEIGIPKAWVFDENDDINIEILSENDIGKVLKIFPKTDGIVIDDLIAFVQIIIETNERIKEKENEFSSEIEEMKNILEKKAKKHYEELEELKENSFKHFNDNFTKTSHESESGEKRKRKSKTSISGDTGTENTIVEKVK